MSGPQTLEEAEAELIEAWRAGDDTRAAAAEKVVDELDRLARERRKAATLHSVALWYAARGFRVFPLIPGTKIPFKGSNGCLDGSSNPDVVNGWWNAEPDANIGLATGHRVDVVDIDGLPGQTSRARHWDEVFAKVDADQLAKVLTPRPGGMHIYVPATGDGNRAGIVPGVDYRGKGGYVVAPPSVITEEAARKYDNHHPGHYEFLGTPNLDLTDGAA
ncbi:bifunctional DNA primase/polymerase [Nocardioides stalactiti]|uniref:bifunctional DNA primase/polymerase n=1 Tax=Nocardioides stalactiti TaxID=2755356 RepID=UPI0016027979|nr:bifunctional DNA primase/polymerase [Nocardioides stalactiti]